MSYKGNTCGASNFKDELLKEIKEGKQLNNAAFWFCTKYLDFAKRFKKN